MGLVGLLARDRVIGSAEGAIAKPEACGRCHKTFVYLVHREAVGQANNWFWADYEGATQRADADAQLALSAQLQTAIEPVFCPYCGYLQPHMLQQARKDRAETAAWIGGPVTVILLLLAAYASPEGYGAAMALGAIVLGGGGTLLAIVAFLTLFGPNKGREFISPLKKDVARSAIKLEDYQQSMGEARKHEEDRALEEFAADLEREKLAEQQQYQRELEAPQKRLEAETRRETEMERIAENARRKQWPPP